MPLRRTSKAKDVEGARHLRSPSTAKRAGTAAWPESPGSPRRTSKNATSKATSKVPDTFAGRGDRNLMK